ncbi:serine hydrolase domain-containing protein [Phytomonospora endophytica]|uniref:CubicO group peptidase (Beta-lactamase class C family) n=1 Tax=Phytomonospora endophytica TaxID=714109 RepID=A0A841FPG9_9ACTN|nr:serine hydrolase domain-containing protein [Phytomonospora endophytica]MBB6036743.1 CubicO group peptidase (beta-lactamase class C family) [Phytomonospora endophytica]GIG68223.1 serine hydrolase [Phytomonospora endophytica]
MSSGGFAAHRLGRIEEAVTGHVEKGGVPGAAWIVSRGGETHHGAVGSPVIGGEPLGLDAIFRIASMSKPVTAVAALILVEECRIRLDDPVDELLPELAERKVLRSLTSPLSDTVPASRPVTVRDLLTFTFGFGALFAAPGTYPILDAASGLGVAVGPPKLGSVPEPGEWMRRLGTLPLMHQPGEKWMYHSGSAVLGVLIARASGQPFAEFLNERIFTPLGMKDTGFHVPAERRDRLTGVYWEDPEGGGLTLYDDPADSKWAEPAVFPDGGGDLVSTVEDFGAFARMLLAGGRPLLGRTSVADMTQNHLTPEQAAGDFILEAGYGWGYGVAVATRRLGPTVSEGQYGWDGGLGTSWKNDPRERLTGVLLTNRMFSSSSAPPVVSDFWTSVYQALDD